MSEKIIRAVERDRLQQALPIYKELLNDIEKRPVLSWSTYLTRSLSFILFFAAIIVGILSVYVASTSSKNYGINFNLVDITDPYGPSPAIPTLKDYKPDKVKAYQNWIFRAGPGAQYNGVGGSTSGTIGPTDQQFKFVLPDDTVMDQIITITNASISEVTDDKTTHLPTNGPGAFPFPVHVIGPSIDLQIPKKTSRTFIYHDNGTHKGWFLVGQMDENP